MKNININFNKNIKDLHLEELGDETMDSFSTLVGQQLMRASQGSMIRTDNNSELDKGKFWYTSKREIPDLVKILKGNKNYFKDLNIVGVKILSDDQYDRFVRKKQHIDEMSFDWMMSHVPNLSDIIAWNEEEKNKQQLYKNLQDGSLISPSELKKIKN